MRREVEDRTRIERGQDIVVQPQPLEMEDNVAEEPDSWVPTTGWRDSSSSLNDEVLGHTFVDGLDETSKMNLDSACEGSCMAKPYSEIQLLLNNFIANDNNWKGDGESRRALKQKAAGVIELDDFLAMRADIAKLANQMNRMTMHQTNLERQVRQLASNQNTRPVCALPSDTEKNPQVNAITLRNGRELEEALKKRRDKLTPEGKLIPKATPESKKDDACSEPASATRPPPPFPQRLQKKNDDCMFNKFLSLLSQVQLNTPFVDVLCEIPKYAKYIKDIVALKRRLTEFNRTTHTEECTSTVKNKLPQKLKDPGSFTIPVRIGNIDMGPALCDLGVSINVMPLSLFKKLDLGAPRSTIVMLQLADRSIAYPKGVIEDVLLQIGKFIFPADFIILDYEADEQVPIILGRLLLDTYDAIIKVREGKMIMREDNEEVVFNVYKEIQLPCYYEELSMISVVEVEKKLIDQSVYLDDSLEKALRLFDSLEIDDEVWEMMHILDASCVYMQGLNPFEQLNRSSGPPPKTSIKEAPKLKLELLPPHHQYTYLGGCDTVPVIVSPDLSKLHEEKLLRVLREHKRAIGWTMYDIRGISPAFCMHKILMEDGHKPSVEHQRRLNPIMKEVVRKEVIKWLDADFYSPEDKGRPHLRVPMARMHSRECPLVSAIHLRLFKGVKRQTWLLEKDIPFKFDDACLRAFKELKNILVTAPIIIAPNWAQLFELMCDASDVTIRAILGQRREKIFHSIYYASKTLNPTQMNYTITEKELLIVVWVFDKFRAYLVGTKVIVFTVHSVIRIGLGDRDQKGTENQIGDHLSRLENRNHVAKGGAIKEIFLDEQLLAITSSEALWYADYVNFIASGVMPPELSPDNRRRFLHDVRLYLYNEPFLYKQCAYQLVRKCVLKEEMKAIFHDSYASPYGCHHGGDRTTQKCCNRVSIGQNYLRMHTPLLNSVTSAKEPEQS
ncbi:uncharacterized protein [Nicotiana tomentosiformis]|uniref:uncharacterized protein n=1 Tax=Nicotiana tomentosiformis TaxID=4098 RepID=UPI00388C70CB